MSTKLVSSEYNRKLRETVAQFDALPWGARTQAGNALSISTSYVSNILNGHVQNEALLSELSAWASTVSLLDVIEGRRSTRERGAKLELAKQFLEDTFDDDENSAIPFDRVYERYTRYVRTLGHTPLGYWATIAALQGDATIEQFDGALSLIGKVFKDA